MAECTCPKEGNIILNSCPVHGEHLSVSFSRTYQCPVCAYLVKGPKIDTFCVMQDGEQIATTGYICPMCLVDYINSLDLPVMERIDGGTS